MNEHTAKSLDTILRSPGSHWVGDGFPVRSLFSYATLGAELSPFLLLDYAGPREFPPTDKRLGVGEHPHRGFETVTIVYAGEVEHRDSSGASGHIGPGDVQWMTAASGVVHEEFHGRNFAQQGGMFEMVQLWVNLPAKAKMTAPRYQNIENRQIPTVTLPDGQGSLRVIAGDYDGVKGPAVTFSPIQVWDVHLHSQQPIKLAVPDGFSTTLVVLRGRIQLDDAINVGPAEVALFERNGHELLIHAADHVTALLLSGEPLHEPIFGSGPLVMNTAEEIAQAVKDYQSGKMGHLA
jgi:quercetin 2,3-dioxygenase